MPQQIYFDESGFTGNNLLHPHPHARGALVAFVVACLAYVLVLVQSGAKFHT